VAGSRPCAWVEEGAAAFSRVSIHRRFLLERSRDAMRLRPVNNSATAQNLGIALCQSINIPGGSPPSDLVLGVKDGILTVDLPHEFRAKFDSLFELPFGLAL